MAETYPKQPQVLVDGRYVEMPADVDPRNIFGTDPEFTAEQGVVTHMDTNPPSQPIVSHEIGFARHRRASDSLGRVGIHAL
ncbi:MAG: hypothetical protein JWO61_278 [Candidatus Saccharibacteria bacterium]|nr:hypothetical protein [Candidatus Saccharibacteria bacterium]